MSEQLLYGHNDQKNIVAIERMHDQSLVEIYTRTDGKLKKTVERMPLFALAPKKIIKEIDQNTARVTPLLGNNYYDTLITSNNSRYLYTLRKVLDDFNMPSFHQQYYIQTGKTLFKGMGFDDVRTLCFDIEVITTDGYEFPNAQRKGDEIVIIAMYDNTGWFKVLFQDELTNEEGLIREFIKQIHYRDPDVIVNHNIFNFDLTYLSDRCKLHDIDFRIGRNGDEPYVYETSVRLADSNMSYNNYNVHGRHIIDTMILARQADVVKREFKNYRLKYLAKKIGISSKSRVYVEGGEITNMWHNDPDKLITYALDDVIEAMGVYEHFAQSIFFSTQFIPMGYQDTFRLGSGGKIDNMFMRYYIHNRFSFPEPEPERHISGGYAGVGKYGYTPDPLVYADVKSLYPSLARGLNIQPKADTLGYYPKLLNLLTQKRYSIKSNIKKTDDPNEKDMWKSMDGSVKILLNTMSYGYLSWNRGAFNDYDEAERITKGGQKILKQMISTTQDKGGEVIKWDTDGMLTTIPNTFDNADQYIEWITDIFDEHIIIENDGEYDSAIIFDKKSYALKKKDGEVDAKGQTIRGRSIEPFGRHLILRCVEHIMNDEPQKVWNEYYDLKEMIEDQTLPVRLIAVRGNIKENLIDYQEGVKLGAQDGGRNRSAVYELALQSDQSYQIGDSITYYVKEPPVVWMHFRNKKAKKTLKLKKYESCEFVENYNEDLDVKYYLDRLEKHMKRFLPVLPKEQFAENGIKLKSKDKDKLAEYELST